MCHVSVIILFMVVIFILIPVCTVEPQLSGPHLSGFSVNRTTEMTALLE